MNKIDQKIFEYEQKIEKLKQEKEYLGNLTEEQRMAEEMHELFCTANHADGCGWYYEDWDKPGYAHKHWLEKAQKALNEGITLDEMKKIHDLIR